jgi:hypothetical protein
MGMRFMRRPASLWDGEPAEVVTGPRRFPMKKTWSRSPSAAGRDPGCGPGIFPINHAAGPNQDPKGNPCISMIAFSYLAIRPSYDHRFRTMPIS